MRFLAGLSTAILVAACSGAASNELFSGDPVVDVDAATEPADPPQVADTGDAGVASDEDASTDHTTAKDAATTKDASTKDAAKDASVEKCFFDTDCKSGELCNWKTDQCAAPGQLGAACKRDAECKAGLCNWKLETCSDPAPAGTECRRNKECASGVCGGNSICK